MDYGVLRGDFTLTGLWGTQRGIYISKDHGVFGGDFILAWIMGYS